MFRAIIVALILSNVCSAKQAKPRDTTTHLLTIKEMGAIIQDVEDEIYDHSYQSKFSFVGDAPSGSTRVPIYISPTVDKDSVGEVIYKYMPFGEVSRRFLLRNNGLAVLYGDPELAFPPQLPDTNTLFLNDEDVCRLKSQWKRAHFVVDPNASHERIERASQRQKERVKFSEIESREKTKNKSP